MRDSIILWLYQATLIFGNFHLVRVILSSWGNDTRVDIGVARNTHHDHMHCSESQAWGGTTWNIRRSTIGGLRSTKGRHAKV